MVSFNNAVMKRQRDADRHDVYGLRKLSVGVGSVLLGTMLYAGVSGPVHADVLPVAGGSNTDATSQGGNAIDQTNVQQTNNATPEQSTPAVSTTVSAAPVDNTASATADYSAPQVAQQTVQPTTPVASYTAPEQSYAAPQAVSAVPVQQSSTYNTNNDFQVGSGASNYYVSATGQSAVNLNNYSVTTTDQQNYQVGFNQGQIYSGNVTLPNLADVQSQFKGAQSVTFNPATINSSNVQKVTSLNVSNTNQQKLSMPEDLSNSFNKFTNLKQLDLSNVDSSNVKNLNGAFANLKQLQTINLSNWNTKSVSDVRNLFAGDRVLSQIKGVENWNLTNAASLSNMFKDTSALQQVDLHNVKTSEKLANTSSMFDGSGIASINFGNMDFSHVKNASRMFADTKNLQSLSGLTVEKTTGIQNASEMFKGSGLKEVNANWISGQNLTNASGMFADMPDLEKIDNLKDFGYRNSDSGTAKIQSMDHFIDGDSKLSNIDLSGFANTTNLTNLDHAFSNSGIDALDVSYLNPVNVTSMNQMANNDPNLKVVALGRNFNAHAVQDLQGAFANDPKLETFDLSNFSTGTQNVNANKMFSNNAGMKSLSGFQRISANQEQMLDGVNPAALYGVLLVNNVGHPADGRIAQSLVSGQGQNTKQTAVAPALFAQRITLEDLDYQPGMTDKNGNPLHKDFTYGIQGEKGQKLSTDVQTHIPDGYELAGGKNIYPEVIIGQDVPTMYIVHKHNNIQGETDEFVWHIRRVYKDAQGKEQVLGTEDRKHGIGYTLSTDLVTGKQTRLDYQSAQFDDYHVPAVNGFHLAPGQTDVVTGWMMSPNGPKEKTTTIYYQEDAAQQVTHTVQFVDDDYHDGDTDMTGHALSKNVGSYTVTGDDNTGVNLNIDNHVPKGYRIVPNTTYPVDYVLHANDNQPTVIHLTHLTTSAPKTVNYTRSIKGMADDMDQPLYTQTQTISATFNVVTDEVTGKSVERDVPAGLKFDQYKLPDEPGYIADKNMTELPEQAITKDTPEDTQVVVHYHHAQGKYTVTMVDDDYQAGMKTKDGADLKQTIGSYALDGQVGNTVNIDLQSHIPAGYMMIPGVEYPSTEVMQTPTDGTTVHLIHIKDNVPKTGTYHRDIKGVVDGQSEPLYSFTQDAQVNYTAQVDRLTGKTVGVTFPDGAQFDAYQVPDETKNGYIALDPLDNGKLPALKITKDSKINTSQVIHYKKVDKQAIVQIQFVDTDNDDQPLDKTVNVKTATGLKVNLQQYINIDYPDYEADPDQNQMNGDQIAPYTVGDGATQTITVYLRHKIDQETQTREIHRLIYAQDPVTKQNTLLKDQVVTATRTHTYDMVNPSQAQDTPWKMDALPALDLSAYKKDGYTMQPGKVDAMTLSADQIANLKAGSDGKYKVPDVIISYVASEKPAAKVNVHVQFIDADNNNAQLGKNVDIASQKGQKVNLQQYLNNQFKNFDPDAKQDAMDGNQLADYMVTDQADQTVKVYLHHKTDVQNQTREIHRRIYVQDPTTKQNKLVQDQVVTASRQHVQDLVDQSKSHDTDWNVDALPAMDLSQYKKDGYTMQPGNVASMTLSNDQVNQLKAGSDGKYAVPDVVVTYTVTQAPAQQATVHLQFIDTVGGNKQLGKNIDVQTKQGQQIDLQHYLDDQFKNYVADTKQDKMNGDKLAAYTVTGDKDQTVKIYLKHKIDDEIQKRQIHRRIYVQDPTTKQDKLVKDQVVIASRHHVQDMANPKLVQNSDWTADDLPAFDLTPYQKAGYKMTPDAVDSLKFYSAQIDGLPQDKDGSYHVQDVIISYVPENMTIRLQFVDADDNNAVLGSPTTLTGKQGDSVDWTKQAQVPAGYELDSQAPKQISFDKSKTVTIPLRHKKTAIPDDQDHQDVLHESVTRLITFENAKSGAQLKPSIKQTESFSRQGWHDEVTGQDTYGQWKLDATSTNAKTPSLDAVDIPTIKGFKAEDGQKVDTVSLDPNKLPEDSTVTILYNIDGGSKPVDPSQGKVTITFKFRDADTKQFIGDPFTMNGKQGTTAPFLLGKTMIPDGYSLTEDAKKQVTPVVFDQNRTIFLDVVKDSQDVTNDPKYKDQTHQTLTRTITFEGTDNNGKTVQLQQPVVQTIHATRTATLDRATQKVTFGQWTFDSPKFSQVKLPTFNGWRLKNPDEKVDSQVPDMSKINSTIHVQYVQEHKLDPKQETTLRLNFKMVDDDDANDKVMNGDFGMKPIELKFVDQVGFDLSKLLADNNYQGVLDAWLKVHPQYDYVKLTPGTVSKSDADKITNATLLVHFKHHIQTDVQHTNATEEIQFVNGHGENLGHSTSLKMPVTITTKTDLVSGKSQSQLTFDGQEKIFPAYDLKGNLTKYFEGRKVTSIQVVSPQFKDVEKTQEVPAVTPTADDHEFVVKVVLGDEASQPSEGQQSIEWCFIDTDDNNKVVGAASATGKVGSDAVLNGASDAEHKLLTSGYVLAKGEQGVIGVKIGQQKQVIEIKVAHAKTLKNKGKATAQVIINYKNADGSDFKPADIENLEAPISGYFDEVTKQFVANPDGAKLISKVLNVDRSGYQAILTVQGNGAEDQSVLQTLDGQQVVVIPQFVAKNGSTTHLTVTYQPEAVENVTKKINFVTKDGQIVGNQDVTGQKDSSQHVDYKLPNGYHTLDGTAGATVAFTDNSSISVLVTKDGLPTVTKTISFVDKNTKQSVGNQTVQGQTGTNAQIDLNVPAGYDLVGGVNSKINISFDANGTVTVLVQKHHESTQIKRDIVYVLNGQTIVGRQSVTGTKGQPVQVQLTVPNGYHTITGDASLLLPMNDTTDYQVAVDRTQGQTMIKFIDQNGQEVGYQVASGYAGDHGMVLLILPNGYHTVSGSDNLNVIYGEPATVNVTKNNDQTSRDVNYVNDKGDTISTQPVSGNTGSQKTIALNVPTGYHTVSGQTSLPVSFDSSQPINIAIARNAQSAVSQPVGAVPASTSAVGAVPVAATVTPNVSAPVANNDAGQLPQTGNQNVVGLVALGVLTLGLGFGLLADKKKQA